MGRSLLLVAGEASGEGYGARLVEALAAMAPGVECFGVGGDAMRRAGVDLVADVRETAVVGLTEIVSRIGFFRALKARLLAEAARRGTRVAVLIDFSGFNLRLARDLAGRGVAVVWYVSPQVWAWRQYRARTLGRVAREILVVFPFEVEFYRSLGIEATFVGHPLAKEIVVTGTRAELRAELSVPPGAPLISLLPGSRRGELARIGPVMAGALGPIREATGAVAVVAAAPGIGDDLVAATLPGVRVLRGRTRELLAHADLSLLASGTATVEAALLGAPMIVLYRMSALTFSIVRRLVKVRFAAMPNLLLGEAVVPELLQEACTPERVSGEAIRLLEDDAARDRMRARLLEVRALLAKGDPSAEAAARVAAMLDAAAPTGAA